MGLVVTFGGPDAPFTTLAPPGASDGSRENLYVNLFRATETTTCENNDWGRCVVHVSDVDETYRAAVEGGLEPEFAPRDADWGERYFHLRDPSGHELSFARRIPDHPRWSTHTEGGKLDENT